MAKTPEERPSLAEMRQVFADVREGRAIASSAGPAPAAPSRRPAFHFVLVGLGVVLVGALSFVLVRLATH